MTDQPYEGSPGSPYDNPYSGYDPYAGQYPQQSAVQQPYPSAQPQQPADQQAYPPAQQQAWPAQQQAYGDPQAAGHDTQHWQGQTWDTQTHARPSAAAAETAYLPPVGHQGPVAAHGVQGGGGHGAQAPSYAPQPQPQAPASAAAAETAYLPPVGHQGPVAAHGVQGGGGHGAQAPS
ncbi:hypothetical protein ACFRNR_26855, partial [Streptomyces sp. NPDC056820]